MFRRLLPIVAVPVAVVASAIASATMTGAPRQESQPGFVTPGQAAPTRARTPEGWAPRWLAPGDRADYTGSAACARCHEKAYGDWKQFLHVRMTKQVGDGPLLGDFTPGTRFSQHGRSYTVDERDGRYFISVSHGGRPAEKFEVHYTLGFKRAQGFLTKLRDGRIYVLPAFWSVAARRWFDWKEITPVPDTDQDLRQIWNITCFNCHATNLEKNFDVETRTYQTTWTEMGIGCEGCHGPGAAHIELATRWEKEPATRPVYDSSAENRGLSRTLKIFSNRSAHPRQGFDLCAYCHGNKHNLFVGFVPGDRYEDYALPFLVSQPSPPDDQQGDFWPDGRASRFNRNQTLMLSGCFLRSEIECTSCHAAHGSGHPHSLKVALERSDLLCTQCHGDIAKLEKRHTHHAPGTPGGRCIDCHMSNVNWRLLTRRLDHTFKPPVPEMTAKYGVPNACNECHDDKTPEWATDTLDKWYGEKDHPRRAREMKVADAMYDAASGDMSALPRLASLLLDRSHGPAIRAAAAEFIGRVVGAQGGFEGEARAGGSQTSFEEGTGAAGPGARLRKRGPSRAMPVAQDESGRPLPTVAPAIVNALMGAAADPEAIVRAHAVRTLGQLGDRRALTSLTARLVDDTRAVRIASAEALLKLGVATLPGKAGAALARAQDEYAESLAAFGDAAGDHLALGRLQMERGLESEARASLGRARSLDAANPQPRVLLGIIEARNGRYDTALREWRSVRAEFPGYPNLDQLIAEAEKRREVEKPR